MKEIDVSDPRLNAIRKKFSDDSISLVDNQGLQLIHMDEKETLTFLLLKILERLAAIEKTVNKLDGKTGNVY